jgi:hypothetical protein
VKSISFNEFLVRSKIQHNDLYEYDESSFSLFSAKIRIKCKNHGWFFQRGSEHVLGNGCKRCGEIQKGINQRKDNLTFINQVKSIIRNRFDLSKIKYVSARQKVELICWSHGSFWVSPTNLLRDNFNCPKCKLSSGEKFLLYVLDLDGEFYQSQKEFSKCVSRKGNKLKFDFYVPSYKLLIEFDGIQHYQYCKHLHRNINKFNEQMENDSIKDAFARNNGYLLLRFKYNQPKKLIREELTKVLTSDEYKIIDY